MSRVSVNFAVQLRDLKAAKMQLEVTITKLESERSVTVEHSKTIETLRAELKNTARQVLVLVSSRLLCSPQFNSTQLTSPYMYSTCCLSLCARPHCHLSTRVDRIKL